MCASWCHPSCLHPIQMACYAMCGMSSWSPMGTALGLSVPNPCTQVPAAAKTAAAPPTTIREQLQAKNKQDKDLEGKERRLPNDASTYLKRLADGTMKASEEIKAEAVAALSVFRSLSDKKQKLEFSKKILENRKSLAWTKTWSQQYRETSTTKETMISGMMTRTRENLSYHGM